MKFGALAIVILVWGIIATEFFLYMYFYVPILYKHRPLQVYIYVPFFIVWVILLCISYYYSIMVQPGTPSSDINTHFSDQIDDLKNFAKKDSEAKKARRKQLMNNPQARVQQIQSLNQTSYCFKCDKVKEIRVHHCKICKKCIQRMDHHCPWVGNCVGKYNHKYFILFLFYASTALFMASISIMIDFGLETFSSEKEFVYYILVACCFTTLMLALAIGFLFVTQMLSSIQNLTTLETFVEGINQLNPWDKGSWIRNLQQIFGADRALWMLPTTPDFQSIEYRPLNV